MAGRLTFKGGRHPSRDGGWAHVVSLSPETVDTLQAAIGRALTCEEMQRLADSCTSIAAMVESSSIPAATRQDVGRSLRAITGLGDDEAAAAYRNVDANSAALIRYALAQGAQSVAAAARDALAMHDDMPSTGGRPMKGWHRFAVKAAVHHWRECGGADEPPVLHRGGNYEHYEPSPLLRWVQTFMGAVEPFAGSAVPTNIIPMIEAEIAQEQAR